MPEIMSDELVGVGITSIIHHPLVMDVSSTPCAITDLPIIILYHTIIHVYIYRESYINTDIPNTISSQQVTPYFYIITSPAIPNSFPTMWSNNWSSCLIFYIHRTSFRQRSSSIPMLFESAGLPQFLMAKSLDAFDCFDCFDSFESPT